MAIYQEDEYKEVIRRVKQKIAELKIEIGANLSEEEISRFEKQCHITRSIPLVFARSRRWLR